MTRQGSSSSAHVESLSVAEANREFYRCTATTYDESEYCAVDPRARRHLRRMLERATTNLPEGARVLDACGGSGNASLILAELGLRPVIVDISKEMLAIWRDRAARLEVDCESIESEILDFLVRDTRRWDVIVFSSALHHMNDYETVLAAATVRLTEGGRIVTSFDPINVRGGMGTIVQWVRRLDYIGFTLIRRPADFRRKLAARLLRSDDVGSRIGAKAERHALTGIDDDALVRTLHDRGALTVERWRTYDARLKLSRGILRILRAPTGFSLIAHASSDSRDVDYLQP